MAKRVVGYGFNSNGRYGQGGLIRERFAPRLKGADPKTLLDADGGNLDPDKVWAAMMSNEKPGGHGERSVALGTGFPDGVRVENGHITMPDLPGIGFEGKSDLYKEMKALAA
jgi:L-alanine-DL-glutamate epimerase-like enolase superfamily enzyme